MESVAKAAYVKKVLTMSSEDYLTRLFVKQADKRRFGDLKKPFVNDGLKGDSSYPMTLKSAVAILKG